MSPMIASRNYYPGDLIYSEESFAQVLPRKFKDIFCEWCCTRSFTLKACKQCLAVKYCGKTCQKNDWSTHRLECVRMKLLPDSGTADIVRLLGKVILKIKGKDWKIIKKRIMGTDVTFDDVDCHYKDMTENPRLNLLYKELREHIENFVGKENLPGDVDLIKIVGKVKFNTFSTLSIGFYIGASTFDVECITNTNLHVWGRSANIRAVKRIVKGVDQISIPSRKVLSLDPEVLMKFEKSPCKCSDCSLPYGESVLTRIVDDTKAYSVILVSEATLSLAAMPECEFEDEVGRLVDEILRRQEGVLGNTNLLRLKLLAFRCFKIGGRPRVLLRPLLELEKHMSHLFGELYSEMLPIYEALLVVHFETGNLEEAVRCIRKVKAIEMLMQM